MRILIADDEPQVRSAIRLLLEHESRHHICVETGELTDLTWTFDDAAPDLLLVDWEMKPPLTHDKWLLHLRKRWPGLKVIAMSGRPESRHQAYSAGVDYFVSKGDPPETLVQAVRSNSQFFPNQSD